MLVASKLQSRRRRFVRHSLRRFCPQHWIKLDEDIIQVTFLTMAIVASGFRERLSPVFELGTSASEAEISPAFGEALGAGMDYVAGHAMRAARAGDRQLS